MQIDDLPSTRAAYGIKLIYQKALAEYEADVARRETDTPEDFSKNEDDLARQAASILEEMLGMAWTPAQAEGAAAAEQSNIEVKTEVQAKVRHIARSLRHILCCCRDLAASPAWLLAAVAAVAADV